MIKFFFRRHWVLWGFLACWLPAVLAQTGPVIRKIEIRHVGPPAASEALIKANIKVKVGEVFTRTGVDDDVKNLYNTGLFYNIRVAQESTVDGLNLAYVLQGKPLLTDIRFQGNKKYRTTKLLKRVTSKIGEPMNERKLFSDSQEIQKMYQKAGLQKTEVKYVPNIDEGTGRATVVFEVNEAPKIRIIDVEFVDAQAFTQRKLRKVIKTRRHWMFSWLTGSGKLKDEVFDEDKQKLAEFYQDAGYIDYELKDVQFEYPEPRRMIVRFIVSEGAQYRVGSVEFTNNVAFSAREITNSLRNLRLELKLQPGEIFTPKNLQKDVEAVRDFYGAKGYVDSWVRPIKSANTERGTIDLAYDIRDEDKGKSSVEKIEIRGNIRTKDKVIRRELSIAPGEVFNMLRVKQSKSRLEQMGYFDKVETDADADPNLGPGRKNLVIDVEEGSTGNFEVGAGFSSVDNLVGFVGYREGNFDLFNPPFFRGGGQKLRIHMQLGTRRKDFMISFVEPWFLDKKLILGTDLYYRELSYYSDIYDIRQAGVRLSLTKALWSDFIIGTLSYTIENIGLDNIDTFRAPAFLLQEDTDRLVSKIGASIAWDTRNNALLPDGGQRTELLTELAGGPFAGDTDFYKIEARSAWYFPGLFKGHVIESGVRAGVIENYGRSDRVPLFDRFFLGGVYSLRGYKYRRVGPFQGEEPMGGETFWYGSVEYSLPIIERLRFALFYDIGNVYVDAYSFDLAQDQKFYNDNWGVGFRLNIPRLGPLRLDYGLPLTHDRFNSGSGRFQFSVGFTRDF